MPLPIGPRVGAAPYPHPHAEPLGRDSRWGQHEAPRSPLANGAAVQKTSTPARGWGLAFHQHIYINTRGTAIAYHRLLFMIIMLIITIMIITII